MKAAADSQFLTRSFRVTSASLSPEIFAITASWLSQFNLRSFFTSSSIYVELLTDVLLSPRGALTGSPNKCLGSHHQWCGSVKNNFDTITLRTAIWFGLYQKTRSLQWSFSTFSAGPRSTPSVPDRPLGRKAASVTWSVTKWQTDVTESQQNHLLAWEWDLPITASCGFKLLL